MCFERRLLRNPKGFLTELQAAYKLRHVLYGDLIRGRWRFASRYVDPRLRSDLERLIRDNGTLFCSRFSKPRGGCSDPPSSLRRTCPGWRTRHRFPGSQGCIDRAVLIIPLVPPRPGVAFFACNTGPWQILLRATRSFSAILRRSPSVPRKATRRCNASAWHKSRQPWRTAPDAARA